MRNIFIACDTSDPKKVKKLLKITQFKIKGYRIYINLDWNFFILLKVVSLYRN